MSFLALGSTFLMGLLGGIHCVLMCGGVVAVLSAGMPAAAKARFGRKLPYLLAYNGGRIGSYALLGAVAGGLGAAGTAALPTDTAPLVLRVVAALVLVLAGAYLAGVFRALGHLERVGAPFLRLVQPAVTRALRVESPAGAFAVGLLWGLMPCGMVYAALALALVSGGALAGSATLAAFGLGTLPALLLAGGVAEIVRALATAPAIRRTAGLLIALSGAVHLTLAGMQAGFIPTGAPDGHASCCVHEHARDTVPMTRGDR